MKKCFCVAIVLLSMVSFGQTNYKITYSKSSNGKLIEDQDLIFVFSNEKQSVITSESVLINKAKFPFEQTLITASNYFQIANLSTSKTIATKDSVSIGKQNFEKWAFLE